MEMYVYILHFLFIYTNTIKKKDRLDFNIILYTIHPPSIHISLTYM